MPSKALRELIERNKPKIGASGGFHSEPPPPLDPQQTSWSHLEDGTHVIKTLEVQSSTYYIRPVAEPFEGLQWELWTLNPDFIKLDQVASFLEAVKVMELHYSLIKGPTDASGPNSTDSS